MAKNQTSNESLRTYAKQPIEHCKGSPYVVVLNFYSRCQVQPEVCGVLVSRLSVPSALMPVDAHS